MLHPALISSKTPGCRTIRCVTSESLPAVLAALPAAGRAFVEASCYAGKAGATALVPGAKGRISDVLFGIGAGDGFDPFVFGKLFGALPAGDYALSEPPQQPALAVLAFAMASYRFDRYKKRGDALPRLVVPDGVDGAEVTLLARAVAEGRDLINTPANDLGPDALAKAALNVADRYGAEAKEIAGKRLIKKNFPLIHAVGRAAAQEPRLVTFTWGDERYPKVTLVGKGVCFDTGGLDLKPSSAMLLMKKDMGGAATALAAAAMIMGSGLKVRLKVLIPIVENAVAGDSFRPGDILPSRKGLTVEIGNTDAEGRLILADALAKADEEAPDLLIDYATLTGAARVALGQDLPPFYTDDEALAAEISAAAAAVGDPVWRMPLWKPYEAMIDSKIADINNAGSGAGMAGSITAALFLRRFVENATSYAHFDIYGWTMTGRNGLPEGGNPQAARLTHALIAKRYG